MTLAMVRRLVSDVCAPKSESASASCAAPVVEDVNRMSLEACLRRLAEVVLKDASKEKVDQILASRNICPAQAAIDKTVIDNMEDLDIESDADEDPAEVLEELRHFEQDVLNMSDRPSKLAVRLTGKRGRQPSDRRAHENPGGTELPWRVDRPLSYEEAKPFFPVGCVAVLETTRHQRWKCRASYMPKWESKVFDGREGLSQDQSLKIVLSRAWQCYTRHTGTPCPYNLDLGL
eukprot:326775-Amphidinium_carterae.2